MKDFGKKFERAFEDALKHRDGLDAAVQSFKDKVSALELSGRSLEEFAVYRIMPGLVGIRHDPKDARL